MPVTDPSAIGGSDDYTLIVNYYDYDGTLLATKKVLNKASSFGSSNKYNNFSPSDVAENYPNSTPTRLGYVFSGWGNIQTSENHVIKSLDTVSGEILQDCYSYTKTISATAQYDLATCETVYAIYTFFTAEGEILKTPNGGYKDYHITIDATDFLSLYPNASLIADPELLLKYYTDWSSAGGGSWHIDDQSSWSFNRDTGKIFGDIRVHYDGGNPLTTPFFARALFDLSSSENIVDRTANSKYYPLNSKYDLPRISRLEKKSAYRGISTSGNNNAFVYTSDMKLQIFDNTWLSSIAPWSEETVRSFSQDGIFFNMIPKGSLPTFKSLLLFKRTAGYYRLTRTDSELTFEYKRRENSEIWTEKAVFQASQFRGGTVPTCLLAVLQGPGGAGGISYQSTTQSYGKIRYNGGGGGGSGSFAVVALPLDTTTYFAIGEGQRWNSSSSQSYFIDESIEPKSTYIGTSINSSDILKVPGGAEAEPNHHPSVLVSWISKGGSGGGVPTHDSSKCHLIVGKGGSKGGDGAYYDLTDPDNSYSRGDRGENFTIPSYTASISDIKNSIFWNFYPDLKGKVPGNYNPGQTVSGNTGDDPSEFQDPESGIIYYSYGGGGGAASSSSSGYGSGGNGGRSNYVWGTDDARTSGANGYIALYY